MGEQEDFVSIALSASNMLLVVESRLDEYADDQAKVNVDELGGLIEILRAVRAKLDL